MASSHHLHARKKHYSHDEEDVLPHTTQLENKNDSTKKKRRLRRSSSWWSPTAEMECAASAVGFFLLLGLSLTYILLHHQHRKVIAHVIKDPWGHGRAVFRRKADGFHHHFYSGSPRFVTVVMPSVVHPEGRSRRLDSIHETWGPHARAIFVLHNQTEFPQGSHLTLAEKSSPSDRYRYPQSLLVPADISVEDGLPRLYHTIRTIFERVNPDFCFFVNDHTFVIPEHLCEYLEGRDPNVDLYAGHALKNGNTDVFNSGAAGYILSRGTMQKLVDKWDQKDPTCWIGPGADKWLQENPGLVTVQCLQSLGIEAFDTREDGKWHRFHAFPLTRVVAGKVDQWYINKHDGMDALGYDKSYTKLLDGEDCCAEETVSFHYVEYKECRALFEIRKALLQTPDMTNDKLKNLMIQLWPSEFREIGGYSRGLPKATNDEAWHPLLAVMRKISQPVSNADCYVHLN